MLKWPVSRPRNRQELLKLSTPLQLRLPCCEGTLSRVAVAHSSPNSKPTLSPMPPILTRLATAMRHPAAALREGQVAQGAGRTKPDGPTGPYESSFSAREGRAKRHYTWWVMFVLCQLNIRTPDMVDNLSFLHPAEFPEHNLFLVSHNKHPCSQKSIHMFRGVCDTQTIARPGLVSAPPMLFLQPSGLGSAPPMLFDGSPCPRCVK